VHAVYTDQQIFDQEMEKIWERTWVYCGHESQVPKPGDYYTVQIGRQPMVMVRAEGRQRAGAVQPLPAPRRAAVRQPARATPAAPSCARTTPGASTSTASVRAIPLMPGYDGTRLTRDNPDCSMKRAARVDSYRGFVFASLAADGESAARSSSVKRSIAFDDMCDRSPVGEVEVVPICHRVSSIRTGSSSWRTSSTRCTRRSRTSPPACRRGRVEKRLKAEQGKAPLYYHYLSTFASSFDKWDAVQTINFPHGHGILKAYMGLRPQDPDTLEHEAMLKKAYGERRRPRSTCRAASTMCWCTRTCRCSRRCSSCAACARSAPDKTLSEIWHFRLKGAPEAIYRRSLWYYNLVNSPATMINADDLENWTKGQWGLQSNGGDWVSFHRHYGDDRGRRVLSPTRTTAPPRR
jgi:hypothetical protein